VKQAIAPHVKDADTRVLLAAMDAAYYLHMRESREDLLANLDHQDASVRVSATQCLALMGFSEAAVPISKLLKDREPDVRKSAARELLSLCGTEHCDPAVGGALLEALPDKSLGPDIARTIAILPIPAGRQPVLWAFQADLAHDALWLVDFSEKDIKDLASFFGPEATRQILGQYLSKGPAPVRYRSALYLGGSRPKGSRNRRGGSVLDVRGRALRRYSRAVFAGGAGGQSGPGKRRTDSGVLGQTRSDTAFGTSQTLLPSLHYSRKWNTEEFFVRAKQRCDKVQNLVRPED